MDTEGNIIIEYNDDKTETINSENQTSTIQSNDGKITEEYNSARELTKKQLKKTKLTVQQQNILVLIKMVIQSLQKKL